MGRPHLLPCRVSVPGVLTLLFPTTYDTFSVRPSTLLPCPVLFFSFLFLFLFLFLFSLSPFLLLVLSYLDLISYLLSSFNLFSSLVLPNEPTR